MSEKILNNINDGVISADAEGRINYLNPSAEELIGVSSKDAVGKDLSQFIKLKDELTGSMMDFPLDWVIKNNLPIKNRNHSVLISGDIEKAHLSFDITPLQIDNKSQFLIVLRDVTAAKKETESASLQLSKANRELEEFIYIASHDLQEPLRMVTSYVQLLEKRYKGRLDGDADEFISYAVNGVSKMKNILNDLLAYSRLNTKKEELAYIDINELALKITSGYKSKYSEKVHFEIDELPQVLCYGSQVIQLFYQLIDNAVKFNGSDVKEIRISVNEINGNIQFSVSDNGIGIDTKFEDKIFSMFQKLHGGSEFPGTGVGLAMCKKIVENHNGEIWLTSKPGAGSVFHFTLNADKDKE